MPKFTIYMFLCSLSIRVLERVNIQCRNMNTNWPITPSKTKPFTIIILTLNYKINNYVPITMVFLKLFYLLKVNYQGFQTANSLNPSVS
jgi:hypothetical protein